MNVKGQTCEVIKGILSIIMPEKEFSNLEIKSNILVMNWKGC
ncbi:MAG: hypothetical protein ACTSVI_17255 [Promethearchaeota archaeon]